LFFVFQKTSCRVGGNEKVREIIEQQQQQVVVVVVVVVVEGKKGGLIQLPVFLCVCCRQL